MNLLNRKQALKQLLIFAGPIILGQVGLMLIGTGDMIIAGRFSREALAAIGLAISIANPVMMLGLGLQFAISPLLAQKRGQGEDVSQYFWTVVFFSLIIGVVTCVMTLLSVLIIPYLGYEENLNVLIREYLIITSFSNVGICLYQGMKEFFQSQEKIIVANIVALISVGVNLFFNYAFVFGAFGMPNLREAGLAWASLAVRIFMGGSLLVTAHHFFRKSKALHYGFLKEVMKLGTPITISIFFEVMAFCSVTLFVGRFSESQIAANNLALNIGSLAFMIPLSIASAVGVKVGHAYGERKFGNISIFSQVSLFSSFCFTLIMGIVFYTQPEFVLSLYTTDPSVLEWGKVLLFWVACFQLFDGAQVTIAGILRGLGVSRPSSIAIFIGYWIIGIPLGYYLGFHAGMESQGFWIGLALSLALVSIMLAFILRHRMAELNKESV